MEKITTAEEAMKAVQQDGSALEYVPETMKTPELCLEAVKNDGSALKFVPEKLRTEALCHAAVQNHGWALGRVPEHLKTAEMCMEAVCQPVGSERFRTGGHALHHVPEELKTPELCFEAVQRCGIVLDDVPEALLTPELCTEAVRCELRTGDPDIEGILYNFTHENYSGKRLFPDNVDQAVEEALAPDRECLALVRDFNNVVKSERRFIGSCRLFLHMAMGPGGKSCIVRAGIKDPSCDVVPEGAKPPSFRRSYPTEPDASAEDLEGVLRKFMEDMKSSRLSTGLRGELADTIAICVGERERYREYERECEERGPCPYM